MRRLACIGVATALLAVTACQPMGGGSGQVGVSVHFPTAGFRTAMIPDGTTRIELTVTGEGLTSPMTATLTPGSPTTVMIVAAGPKTVKAQAFDDANLKLAEASADVTVVEKSRVQAILSLVPMPKVTPTPSPTPTPVTSPTPPPPPVPSPTPLQTPIPDATPTPSPAATTNPNGGTLATTNPDVDSQVTTTNGTNPVVGSTAF